MTLDYLHPANALQNSLFSLIAQESERFCQPKFFGLNV